MEKDKFGIGVIVMMFITVLVGVILLVPIAQNVGQTRDLATLENDTTMTIAVNDTAQYVTNCRALSDVVIYNETGDVAVPSGQYTVVNNVVHNGALAVEITPDAAAAYKSIWTIDATCQPLTYIAESGGRAMAGLVVLFFALLIALVAMTPAMDKLKDLF